MNKSGNRTRSRGHAGLLGGKGTVRRVLKMLFGFYSKLLPAVIVCLVLQALVIRAQHLHAARAHHRGRDLASPATGRARRDPSS